jgi:hypothetical protein
MTEVKDHILNLPLPNHLNHLMRLFEQFELNLRLHKQRHDIWTCSIDALKAQIESTIHKDFKESHFSQFLTIVPGFYLHKWEMIKGRLTLMIEMPADICEQMADPKLATQQR